MRAMQAAVATCRPFQNNRIMRQTFMEVFAFYTFTKLEFGLKSSNL